MTLKALWRVAATATGEAPNFKN